MCRSGPPIPNPPSPRLAQGGPAAPWGVQEPYLRPRGPQDAVEAADSDTFNSAVSKLGITARPTDEHGAPTYAPYSSSSDDDDDYALTASDSGAAAASVTQLSAFQLFSFQG